MTSSTVPSIPIWPTDPATGTFIPPSIPQPGSPLNNPFGLNLAYDGTDLYFNNGAVLRRHGELDKLDPATGAVLLQTFPADGINYCGHRVSRRQDLRDRHVHPARSTSSTPRR